jgi:hypothetical protein
MSFHSKNVDGLSHQVQGTDRVLESRVLRPRVHIMCEPELLDPPQSLKVPVLNEVEDQIGGNGNESVNRIIENFTLIHGDTGNQTISTFTGRQTADSG